MHRVHLLIVAKYPTPGCVNTRMVPPLSPAQAAALHRVSLRAVVELAQTVDAAVTIVGTPDDRIDDFRATFGTGAVDCTPQGDGDLGQRLTHAIDNAVAGADVVLALGADSPTLPPPLLRRAIDRLAHHDAVLGPCRDGGYYVIGMRHAIPALFDRIDWGGDNVTKQTMERAATACVDLVVLDAWYDLDRFADLTRAAADLADVDPNTRPHAVALRRYIRTLIEEYREWEPATTE
ncbi:MAG: TIGR04282 family arsenosugar biosynthesis glycosyltransferase [Phycisphaerae bacterium]